MSVFAAIRSWCCPSCHWHVQAESDRDLCDAVAKHQKLCAADSVSLSVLEEVDEEERE